MARKFSRLDVAKHSGPRIAEMKHLANGIPVDISARPCRFLVGEEHKPVAEVVLFLPPVAEIEPETLRRVCIKVARRPPRELLGIGTAETDVEAREPLLPVKNGDDVAWLRKSETWESADSLVRDNHVLRRRTETRMPSRPVRSRRGTCQSGTRAACSKSLQICSGSQTELALDSRKNVVVAVNALERIPDRDRDLVCRLHGLWRSFVLRPTCGMDPCSIGRGADEIVLLPYRA